MFCTYGAKAGSMCSFKCDAFFTINENSQNPVVIPSPHELEGEKEITCGECAQNNVHKKLTFLKAIRPTFIMTVWPDFSSILTTFSR